jgi:HSP20 family protein
MTAWNDLLGLQNELQRLLQSPPGFFREPSAAGVFPALNVFRNPDGVVIRAELPGVDPADVSVTAEGRRLTISGERKASEEPNGGYHRRERPWGKFSRSITLPADVDGSQAGATLRDGVLTLSIPQHESSKRRQIAVQS